MRRQAKHKLVFVGGAWRVLALETKEKYMSADLYQNMGWARGQNVKLGKADAFTSSSLYMTTLAQKCALQIIADAGLTEVAAALYAYHTRNPAHPYRG